MDQRLRRAAPFFLTVALPFLGGLDWYARRGWWCRVTQHDCYGSALLKTVGLYLVVLAAAAVIAAVAIRLFRDRVERALDYRLGRLLFNPSDRTLATLVPVVLATLAFARPLFDGQVTSDQSVWLALAFPYYPFVVGLIPPFYLLVTVESPPAGGWLLPVVLVGLVLLASALEVAWLYLLAAGLGRAFGGLWQTVEAIGVK